MSRQKNSSVYRSPSKKHHWYFYLGLVLLALVLLVAAFLAYMTITEYRPDPVEPAETGSTAVDTSYQGEPLRILSFNTGYTGLGKDASFLMDGGTGTGAPTEEEVAVNLQGVKNILSKADADIYMLQEVDKHSQRTYHQNHIAQYEAALADYEMYYAPNYVCNFVPYPIQKPIGQIHSGIATYSRFHVESAVRESLPIPFKWPIRTANLKRCLLVSRIPIDGTDHELVIVNLHLEAYDDGSGKAAQTEQLLGLLSEEYKKGNYVIAGGDFNQTFHDVETIIKPTTEWVPGVLDTFPEGMQDWRYIYDASTPTCRLLNQPYDPDSERTQYYVLDGFIVSPNVEVVKVETLDEKFEFSDHNPVLMDIQLKK